MGIKDYLKGKVDDELLKRVTRGFEIIGDVVVINLPDDVMKIKDLIVEAILSRHKHVKTILRKVGEVEGVYRVARYEVIYGGETETVVREHGCRFLVDPTKVYYSVKLSGERERIAKMVKEGERVLVMFAGVGPYAIVIARLSKPKEVIGVEINPKAVEYFRRNVRLNKVEDVVKVYEGDVRDVVPRLEGKFDRILMPAPYSAEDYVYLLKDKVKEGTFVHYYTFAGEEEEDEILPRRVVELFGRHGMEVEVKKVKACGSFAPRVYRYVLDLEVKRVNV